VNRDSGLSQTTVFGTVLTLVAVLLILSSAAVAQESGGSADITFGMNDGANLTSQAHTFYSPDGGPAIAGSGDQASIIPTVSTAQTPPEPSLSYIDNVCGMLPDGQVRVRDSIFSSEISGCLLGFRPEQVAQAGWGPCLNPAIKTMLVIGGAKHAAGVGEIARVQIDPPGTESL